MLRLQMKRKIGKCVRAMMGLFGQKAMTPKLQVVVHAGAVNQTVIKNFSINSKSSAIIFTLVFLPWQNYFFTV